MSEPPLIYAFHGVVLLHSATQLYYQEHIFLVWAAIKIKKNGQNIPQSSFYIVQAVGCILGTLI